MEKKTATFLSPFLQEQTGESVLVVLNSPTIATTPPSEVLLRLWNHSKFRVCADGGANRLFDSLSNPAAFIPDLIIGDLDSLRDDVEEFYRAHNVRIEKDEDQDTNDLDKAVGFVHQHVITKSSQRQTVYAYGAFGGRFDQEMGAIQALFKWRKKLANRFWLYDDCNCAFLLSDSETNVVKLPCFGEDFNETDDTIGEGPVCGLIPIGCQCDRVRTTGLKWNLDNHPLSFGDLVSTSNYIIEDTVSVQTSQPLVFTAEIRFPRAS